MFIPTSQKSWRNRTEPGTLEHGLLAGISSPNETFYVINLKEIFFFFICGVKFVWGFEIWSFFHAEAHNLYPKFQITAKEEL